MKRLSCFLICLMAPTMVLAANEYAVAKRVEASMVVTGSIVVSPDGSVHSYTLDQQAKLPSAVVKTIASSVPTWRFQPIRIGGKPVLAKAAMSIRVVAKPLNKDEYALSVRGASFGKDDPGESPSYEDHGPPRYPRDAIAAQISGTVYIEAMIDRQGRVAKAAAKQVDLRNIASDAQMEAWRRVLGRAALTAIRHWTFNVPHTGDEAKADHWTVTIPVDFYLTSNSSDPPPGQYGHWDSYVPGPVEQTPWAESTVQQASGSADAIPNDLAFQADQRFVLLTPPGNG